MENVGIVCEYNPFHNGHAKQLSAVHAGGGTAVCLMSGNYVQRGEPALMDKWTRAKAAVMSGADLVLELPIIAAISSAEGFAAGAVRVFSALGCIDTLCFGSESGAIDGIMSTAKALLSEAFPAALKDALQEGISFAAARQRALESLGADASLMKKPNDILAVEYCKAILQQGSALQAMALQRGGDYHAASADTENPSASFLRSQGDWQAFMPKEALAVFSEASRYSLQAGERAMLSRLRAMRDEEFEALPYGSEGLWRKLMHACRKERNLEAILQTTKSKRYARTRLMRMLLCAYLGITKEDLARPAPYVRVLAMNAKGQALLRQMRNTSTLSILHTGERPADREYYALETRATDLFALFSQDKEVPAAGAEARGRVFREDG
ncbi:MAG: nucleotidyltransferase family protein [Oscillospiraceae bacterium]|nr:nucleotidyltransferase family protein [Oscillospiraceae bacterium]